MQKTTKAILLLALALVSPIWAKERPFKAEFETAFFNDPAQSNPPLIYTTIVQGEGKATHLGKTQFDASHTFSFDFSLPDPFLGGFVPAGTLTLTAANGDELHATYSGEVGIVELPKLYLLTFDFEFNGGTGRFANATGSAEVFGITTIVPVPDDPLYFVGESTFTFDGTIDY